MEAQTIISTEHYLSIKLDDELFAISVNKVLEVLEKQNITHIPNMPDFIKGVINFRGDILPVIETRQKFNMFAQDDDANFVIIVIELHSEDRHLKLGITADGVKDVFSLNENEIKDVPEMGTNYKAEFLNGMAHTEQGFIMLLNVDKVFSKDEVSAITESQITE